MIIVDQRISPSKFINKKAASQKRLFYFIRFCFFLAYQRHIALLHNFLVVGTNALDVIHIHRRKL